MLTRIELSFFKCFEFLGLPLSPLTLLTGLNASGKSSVLQALVLLHQTMREHEWSSRLSLNGSAVRLGATPDVVDEEFGREMFKMQLENGTDVYHWTFLGERRDMSMQVMRVSVNGRIVDAARGLRYLLPLAESPRVEYIELGCRLVPMRIGLPLAERKSVESFARRLRNLTYVTAERLAPQDSYALEDPYVVGHVGSRGEHAVSVLHWGRDEPVLDGLALPEVPPVRLRQVEARMRTLFPGFALDLQQSPSANAVTLGLRTSDTAEFHRPVHTGFGLTQTLPIIVAALSAPKDAILLIENPEVHLHPAGQAMLGQFMAEVADAGVQVLVETHSDHVLNGVRRAVKSRRVTSEQVAIHYFRPRTDTGPQVQSPTLDDSGNIDDWPDGFFDQYDKDSNYFAGWDDM